MADEEAALIRAYGLRIDALDCDTAASIAMAGQRIAENLHLDARERCARVLREHGSPTPETLAPTVLGLMDYQPDEPRFSLLVAALLDPSRTGPVAHAVWTALAEHFGEPRESPALDPAWRARVRVLPERLGVEFHYFDVWALFPEEPRGYRLGVLIENKIGAPERPHQLRDYYDRVAMLFGADSLERTRFVFLTPDGREPVSAGESKAHWRLLSWSELAGVLESAAATLSTSLGGRLLQEVVTLLRRYVRGFATEEALATLVAIAPELERADLTLDTVGRLHARIATIERVLVSGVEFGGA